MNTFNDFNPIQKNILSTKGSIIALNLFLNWSDLPDNYLPDIINRRENAPLPIFIEEWLDNISEQKIKNGEQP